MPNKSVGKCDKCEQTRVLARTTGSTCISCYNEKYRRSEKTKHPRVAPRGITSTPPKREQWFRETTRAANGKGYVTESENAERIRQSLQVVTIFPQNKTVKAIINIPRDTIMHTENVHVGIHEAKKNFAPSIWTVMADGAKALKTAIEKVLPGGPLQADERIWVGPYHEPPKENTPEVLFCINRKTRSQANVHMQRVGLCSDGRVPRVSIRALKNIKAGTELFADYGEAHHEYETAPRLHCARGASGQQKKVTTVSKKRLRTDE